jgi:CDP-glucose 4,6-dehydratase
LAGRRSLEDLVIDPGFWAGRRVLVTGHDGFKGTWLSLWLAKMGAEVTGLSSGPPSEPALSRLVRLDEIVDEYRCDVRDLDGVRRVFAAARPEVVLHLAAQPIVRLAFRDPVGTFATNVMGTVHVLDACRTTESCRVVVNVTSDKCYENREWEWAYREDEPMGGFDPYSNSKGCSELVTAAYRQSFFSGDNGVARVGSARAGNVVGGGDWGSDRLIPDIMRGALAGTTIEVRRPDAIRPWQHVLNPLSGYLRLAQRLWDEPALAGAYNFGPDDADAQPVAEIVARLQASWPETLDVRIDPGPHPHEATHLKLDSSRAAVRLGWRPGWRLGETLERIVEWHVAYRDGADPREVTTAQLQAFVAAMPAVS